jgi:peptidoglycan/LPS O-acetylase OafA/YrhL
MNYRADIDGLRALAVIPVLLFHAGFSMFSGGFIGVDIFFVISGFLITSIILSDIKKEKFSFKQFWNRRIRRIVPILFFVMIVTLIAFSFVSPPAAFSHLSKSLLSQVLLSANIFFWTQVDYFSHSSETYPLLHTWSLAVEEQFYLIFPFLIYYLRQFKAKTQFQLLAILGLISLILSIWATDRMPAASFYLLPCRAWELIAGALLAMNSSFNIITLKLKSGVNEFLSVIGIIAILFAIFFFDKETPFPSYTALIPVLGTVFLIQSNNGYITVIGRFLSSRLVVFVGLTSYSLYLWHWPVLVFNRAISLKEPSSSSQLVCLFVSFILALTTYYLIENPTRKNTSFFTSRRIFIFFCSGTVTLLFISTYILQSNGIKERMGEDFVDYVINTKNFNERAFCNSRDKIFCYVNPIATNKVFVWGDSHAVSILPGIIKATESLKDFGVVFAVKHACPSIIETKVRNNTHKLTEECIAYNMKVFDHILQGGFHTVFIVNRYNIYINNRDLFDTDSKVTRYISTMKSEESNSSIDSMKAISIKLKKMRNNFIKSGVNAFFVKQVPNFNIHPPEYANKLQALSSEKTSYTRIRAEVEKRNKNMNDIFSELNLKTLDLMNVFCNKDSCTPFDQNRSFYFDDNHLSVYGAEKTSNVFRKYISGK